MKSVRFRELKPDAGEVAQLIALSVQWEGERSCYGYVANDADSFHGERIFAAETEAGIVGYLYGHASTAARISSAIPDGATFFAVEELYVLPALRSRGIGKRLFSFVEDTLRAEGIGWLFLTTATKDHDAIRRFYTKAVGMTPWSATFFKNLSVEKAPPEAPEIRIFPYREAYRDDMLFMVLSAKNALGRLPRLNEDLLQIEECYLKKGDMFWLAADARDRVVGCVGYSSIERSPEVFLHRLYVKPELKRQGIGSALLQTAETYLRTQGKTAVRVHLGEPKETWFESYAFYEKHGYAEYAPRYWKKDL